MWSTLTQARRVGASPLTHRLLLVVSSVLVAEHLPACESLLRHLPVRDRLKFSPLVHRDESEAHLRVFRSAPRDARVHHQRRQRRPGDGGGHAHAPQPRGAQPNASSSTHACCRRSRCRRLALAICCLWSEVSQLSSGLRKTVTTVIWSHAHCPHHALSPFCCPRRARRSSRSTT